MIVSSTLQLTLSDSKSANLKFVLLTQPGHPVQQYSTLVGLKGRVYKVFGISNSTSQPVINVYKGL